MPHLFGIHSVREALRESFDCVESICFARDLSNPRLRELMQEARKRKIPVRQLPEEALRRLADSASHQGVVAKMTEFVYREREDLVEECPPPGFFLVLDEIQDPQNLGAILRTADGAGVNGVFLPRHHSAGVTAAAVRASAGAAMHLKIARETNLSRLLEDLKEKGFWAVGVDVRADRLWTDCDYSRPTVLVLGNEGRGMRPLVQKHCDDLVKIPMLGKVESLNVSAAAAILLYEVIRQRSAAPTPRGT